MINYTENLKITLDETINQLELISIVASGKVDTGIIAWFNNNEGFVAFLGVIASFVVSVTAIVISVLTYRSQKKEQTKNAQENAKLQRELTEQNNKFQAELQVRQVKLDSYKIRLECWKFLTNFHLVIRQLYHYDNELGISFSNIQILVKIIFSNLNQLNANVVGMKLNELFFVLSNNDSNLRKILKPSVDLFIVFEKIEYLIKNNQNEIEGVTLEKLCKKVSECIKVVVPILPIIINELEKDLDISELHKIPKNSYIL